MAALPSWIAPGEAADRVYDVRADDAEGIGYALLRPRRNGHANSVSQFAYAKLNPVEPGSDGPRTLCGWPTTARDHRLVLAPGVADPVSMERLFGDYDAAAAGHQRLLAAVLTVPFTRDRPLHEQFDAAVGWAMLALARDRQLTSLVVLHAPGDQLAAEAPHAHVLVLARGHHASGLAGVHEDLAEEAHAAWAERWRTFDAAWRRRAE